MCRHVWNLLSSAPRSLEWLLMHGSFNYRVALNQLLFFFPLRLKKDSTLYLCTHIMSPSIAYSYAHTDRQTHAPAAEDEGQGRMGPQKDICKRMASPKQAQRLGCREREQESYQKWQLDWLWQGTDGIERLHQCRKPCHQQFCAFR